MDFLRKYDFSEKEIEEIKNKSIEYAEDAFDFIYPNLYLYEENICASIDLLLLLGVTKNTIAKLLISHIYTLINHHNMIYLLGEEEDIRESINYLNNGDGIEMLYDGNPNTKNQKDALIDFLSNYGISKYAVLKAMHKKSNLYMYRENISTAVKFLHSIGINAQRMEEQLIDDPTVFTYGVEGFIKSLYHENIYNYISDVNNGIISVDYYVTKYICSERWK